MDYNNHLLVAIYFHKCFDREICSKWSHLIAKRTRKAKYLTGETYSRTLPNTPDHVYYRTDEPIDGSCLSTLFPNLIIAEFSYVFRKKVKHEDIVTFVKRTKSLKGLMDLFFMKEDLIFDVCHEIEMLRTDYCIDGSIVENGLSIKQLNFWKATLSHFKEVAQYFPNLERLHICDYSGEPIYEYYNGPICSKLKIVEISFPAYDETDIYYGFQFMDSCPNLQSAFINMESNRFFVDESLKHKSLQDLVIKFEIDGVDWNELKRLFMKYPNLKHLSLRSHKGLENEHVQQLVRMLPNLVLFEVRRCPRVTQMASNFVQNYCKLYGRSIKFYFNVSPHEIQSDWPQLSTTDQKISQGFDFMKNCFLKDFTRLPYFLIPSED